MRIILIETIPNLGEIGDVVSVKNGYAKNFLITKNKAISYSNSNYKIFEESKKKIEASNIERIAEAKEVKSMIENKDIVLIETASDDGHLYGSVKSNSIAKEINNLFDKKLVDRSHIHIEKPIKETGIFEIKIKIHPDVDITSNIYVSRTKSEADSLILSNKSKQQAKVKDQ